MARIVMSGPAGASHVVGSHTWRCSPNRLANALSPKSLKPQAIQRFKQANSYRSLSKEDFDFLIQSPTIDSTLASTDVSSFQHIQWPLPLAGGKILYTPATQFLDTCVDLCTRIYCDVRPKLNIPEGTWSSLVFSDHVLQRGQDLFDPPYLGEDEYDSELAFSKPTYGGYRLKNRDTLLLWILDFTASEGSKHVVFKGGKSWEELLDHMRAQPGAQKCPQSVWPLGFTVAILLDTEQRSFQFLVFHHGGITMSTLLNPLTEIGQRAMLKLLLSVLLWGKPTDAGLPFLTDRGQHFVLPRGQGDLGGREDIFGTLEGIEHQSASIPSPSFSIFRLGLTSNDIANQDPDISAVHRSRHSPVLAKAIWQPLHQAGPAELSKAKLDGEFGILTPFYSLPPTDSSGVPMTNVLFLPEEHERDEAEAEADPITHQPVFRDDPPSKPDVRILGVSLTRHEGEPLVTCKDPQELCLAYAHALLGWLGLYQAGYLHRNVSLNNLVYYKDGIETKPFSVSKLLSQLARMDGVPVQYSKQLQELASTRDTFELIEHLQSLSTSCGGEPGPEMNILADLLRDVARVLRLAHDLGTLDVLGTKCRAALLTSDGDMATLGTSNYYCHDNDRRDRMLAGTAEFMSERLCAGIQHGLTLNPHSFLDDIESFYWCFLWTVLFNDANPPPYPYSLAMQFRERLTSPFYTERNYVPRYILPPRNPNATGCPFMRTNRLDISPFLNDLYPTLVSLTEVSEERRNTWYRTLLSLQEKESFESLYLLTSHSVTFSVVCDLLEILSKTILARSDR